MKAFHLPPFILYSHHHPSYLSTSFLQLTLKLWMYTWSIYGPFTSEQLLHCFFSFSSSPKPPFTPSIPMFSSTPHLAVDHVRDACVRALASFWPDHHVHNFDSWAGPQQLLKKHLTSKRGEKKTKQDCPRYPTHSSRAAEAERH